MGNFIRVSTGSKRLIDAISSAASSQIFWYLSLPWLSRVYSPDAFGLYGQFLAYVGVMSLLVGARADLAILTSSRVELLAVRSAFFKLSVMISISLAIMLGLAWIIWRASFFYNGLIFVALCSSIISARFIADGAALIHVDDYPSLRRTAFSRSLMQSVIQVCSFSIGTTGLVGGKILGDLWGVKGRFRALRYIIQSQNNRASYHWFVFSSQEVDALKKNAKAYKFSLPQTLLNAASQNMPLLILPFSMSAGFIGQYALAFSIVVGPIGLIAVPVRQMLIRRFSYALREHSNSFSGSVRTAIMWSCALGLVGIVLYVPIYYFGNIATDLIFGSGWSQAARLLPLLWLWVGTGLALMPAHALLLSHDGNKLHLIFETVQFLGRVVAILIGVHSFDGVQVIFPFVMWSAISNLVIAIIIFRSFHVTSYHQ